jgi:two-component system, NarL family, sensor kinase
VLLHGTDESAEGSSPVIHEARHEELRDHFRPVLRDDSDAQRVRADELGGAQSPARSVHWPVSVGFSCGLAAVALTLTVAMLVIAVADGDVFFIPALLAPAGAAVIGGLVAVRRPGQPIGTLLCAYGLCGAASAAPFAYARAAIIHFPGSLPYGTPAMWVTSWDYVPAIALQLLILPLVFPDGHLVSRLWRPVLWAAMAFIPLSVIGNAFAPESLGGWLADRPNPYAVQGPLFSVILDVANVWGLAVAVAAAASVAQRWRRGGPVVRQQLKWFLASVPPSIAVAVVVQYFPDALTLGLVLGTAASLLTAVAIGLAVLRYRLYEIDILLNRAVLYGSLSVMVAAVYLAVVAVSRWVFGEDRGLAVQVVATVLAAVALWPLRGRVQRRVDRVFYGDRGVPYDALARLGRRVEEAADTESALESVVKTVADSLRLPYAAVELRLGGAWQPAAAYGKASSQVVAFPLVSQRETVGRLLVGTRAVGEQLGSDDERLLADLARQAGPATHAVALRQALDASRADLVTMREEERRRLRRELHDGLGPTLAGLTLGLDTAQTLSPRQPELQKLLSRLKGETQRAVTDVRRIVYGLRPPALDELGLEGSLREEIGRLHCQAPALAVSIACPGDGLADLPAAVEVACYRIVTEALTNVARHAHAARCWVRIALGRGLDVEVCDDGVGLPEGWRTGVGIASMRERVAELGGELIIEPSLPHGTRIAARLPIREHP